MNDEKNKLFECKKTKAIQNRIRQINYNRIEYLIDFHWAVF